MANLIAKKLSKQPIGTHIEITYGDGATHHEIVRGIITDSDFSSSVAITPPDGEEIVLNFAIVKGLQVIKPLEAVVGEAGEGTRVQFSYGAEDQRDPNLSGTVLENDGKENIEIRTTSGQELILNYSLIRSFLVEQGENASEKTISAFNSNPEPKPAPNPNSVITPRPVKNLPLHQQTPEDWLNASDYALKDLFDKLPRDDRKKLMGVYDSFKYGIKNNDRDKMATAARQARQIIFQQDHQGYDWSGGAVFFCNCLLRRTNLYDHEVALIAYSFADAAYCAWKEENPILAGAYAVTELMEETPMHPQDMIIILAYSVVKANDVSGLKVLRDRLPSGMEGHLRAVVQDAFSAKGIQLSAQQDMDAALTMLSTLYTGTEMGEEIRNWLPEGTEAPKENPAVTPPPAPETYHGTISRLNWSEHTGFITAEDGHQYIFKYQDINEADLLTTIQECLRADLGGKIHLVKFQVEKESAKNILSDGLLVDRARAIVSEATRDDRLEVAFAMCKKALDTPDIRRALGDLVKYALALYKATQKLSYVKEAIDLYEKNITFYPGNAFAVMDVAICYEHLKKYPMMVEHAEKAIAYPGLTVKQRIGVLSAYLRMHKDYYEVSGDKSLLSRMLEKIDELKKSYAEDFAADGQVQNLYTLNILPHRVIAECRLDMLEEAEADYAKVVSNNTQNPYLDELMTKLRARMTPKEKPQEIQPVEDLPATAEVSEPQDILPDEEYEDDDTEEPEEVIPYTDVDGWAALKLSKEEVIDYALSITGPERIPAILAYLRAASSLCKDVAPVYHAVALAANDPLEAPDYSITALLNAITVSDTDYADLNDCCMGAAFLRASFLSGRGYDYSVQGLRESIAVCHRIPALREAYDTLEQFRIETGRAIDIYADYRNQGVKKLNENMDETIRHAEELYTKYILTPPREKSSFARILETKKILFGREGYLAVMLRNMMEKKLDAMEEAKADFISVYLNGSDQFAAAHINGAAVDALVAESWNQAGKNMQLKKNNSTLQGDRRNNLRSNVTEIITTVCQWYALAEQNASLSWKTEQGESSYARLCPQLIEQLELIQAQCAEETESSGTSEMSTGLFLLASTAKELSARLDGNWKFDQEKYMYVDFLRSNQIMLNEDFMPELESTFCVLPEFNILARIRKHVEGPKLSFQDQIDQIYGIEKACNNYGSAERIAEYLEAMGEITSVTFPDNAEQFVSHTEMQTDMGYRDFREAYALAMSYGQIIKSDAFCYTLEDTVRYWYTFCKESKNFGFFTSILTQARNQIHTSARIYEQQLEEQLEALIASNKQYFDEYPDYGEAIREQISNQNFTVAEDWMARIRIGDFSLEVQQAEALGYLEKFWNSFVNTYSRVVDASRPLSSLLGRRDVRNKDTKRAQQLIDNWLSNGNPSNASRIEQLLNLLGWQNIRVAQYQFAAEPRAEIYEVRMQPDAAGLTAPKHPIAAFGSAMEKKSLYVSCLYGAYDCDRLYEKIRTLDTIDGNKVILVDYALGQTERRALAKKLKRRESGLRNTYMVIDRVLITHLANNYNENLINRILVAITMPFSYCQPYVVDSAHTMPPEIFIGRKDELLKIEQSDGVNLIYGGRQLGKSALFKKALSDLDGRNHQRAVLVDIKELDCAAAARKLSTKLIDLGITPDAEITDDWDVLCRNIERRLRNKDEEITYFLLMLDEADAFINDCANCGYRPLVALKDVQQSLPGQFKYVLAGLHNIVRFNRQVALGNNSVITHMPSLKITPFHTPEAEELLTGPLSYLGFSLPNKVTISQILATCNYFPGLIQLYAKKLIESIRAADYAGYDIKRTPPYVVTDEHLRRVMADKEFVDQIHEKFEITLTLDQDQGSYYYPLALIIGYMYSVAPWKNGYTAQEVLFYAKDLAIHPLADFTEDKIDALLMELQDLNILRSISNNSYLLASKNFRDLLGSDEEIFEKLLKVGGGNV